ncbi:hypothetical protein PILCRDRAFT_829092 [Piloderma croceum F 1598]|uniref:Uncharacterized protein n=1 Tax=Piloderma croceum (strain F 1598) TaxID=765440 RepID=A0A0C3ELP3_PILCF|nr:hypothetical protein PILCRDRAFT_829092 [Piloderma croceum F 1598]
MPRICLSGTYADFPAKIFVDSTKPQSTLSTQFSCAHNVPRDVTSIRGVAHVSCSGPVVVPTEGGWFHSRLPFQIVYSSQADVLLGADWIAACQPDFVYGGIRRPLQITLDRLPAGHSWVPIPSTTSYGASYVFSYYFNMLTEIICRLLFN